MCTAAQSESGSVFKREIKTTLACHADNVPLQSDKFGVEPLSGELDTVAANCCGTALE